MTINKIITSVQFILPQHFLSRLLARLANCKMVRVKNLLIQLFIKSYAVNLEEAIESDINQYPSFNDFFIRQLKPSARPIAKGLKSIVSPADSTLSQIGKIANGQLLQAKGVEYSLLALLGGSAAQAQRFDGGEFATFYLSPKDYHRVHMPCDGILTEMIYVPGNLFSVNQRTTETIPHLFSRNERAISLFKTEFGDMALIFVGAMLVAGIHTVWAGDVAHSVDGKIKTVSYPSSQLLAKGSEAGYFKFGSTVIVLFGKEQVQWLDRLKATNQIKVGEIIGEIC